VSAFTIHRVLALPYLRFFFDPFPFSTQDPPLPLTNWFPELENRSQSGVDWSFFFFTLASLLSSIVSFRSLFPLFEQSPAPSAPQIARIELLQCFSLYPIFWTRQLSTVSFPAFPLYNQEKDELFSPWARKLGLTPLF